MPPRRQCFQTQTVELGKASSSDEAIGLILKKSPYLTHQHVIDVIHVQQYAPVPQGEQIDIAVVRQNKGLDLQYANRSEVFRRAYGRRLRPLSAQEAIDWFLQDDFEFFGTIVIGSSPLKVPGKQRQILLAIRQDKARGSKPSLLHVPYEPSMMFRISTQWAFALKKE